MSDLDECRAKRPCGCQSRARRRQQVRRRLVPGHVQQNTETNQLYRLQRFPIRCRLDKPADEIVLRIAAALLGNVRSFFKSERILST